MFTPAELQLLDFLVFYYRGLLSKLQCDRGIFNIESLKGRIVVYVLDFEKVEGAIVLKTR